MNRRLFYKYSLTGIFLMMYIRINRKITIVMKEMRLYRETII